MSHRTPALVLVVALLAPGWGPIASASGPIRAREHHRCPCGGAATCSCPEHHAGAGGSCHLTSRSGLAACAVRQPVAPLDEADGVPEIARPAAVLGDGLTVAPPRGRRQPDEPPRAPQPAPAPPPTPPPRLFV